MRVLLSFASLLVMILSVAILSALWLRFGPKHSTGKPMYKVIIPTCLGLIIYQMFWSAVNGHSILRGLLTQLEAFAIFLIIWIIAVLIELIRIRSIWCSYTSYYEWRFQRADIFEIHFPFPWLYPSYVNDRGEPMGLVLNPLAWYEYLLDWLFEGKSNTNPFRSKDLPEIELLEHLGKGTVTAETLNVRDYPGYPDGEIIAALHKGDVVQIQRTNFPDWYALPSEWDTKIGYVRAVFIDVE